MSLRDPEIEQGKAPAGGAGRRILEAMPRVSSAVVVLYIMGGVLVGTLGRLVLLVLILRWYGFGPRDFLRTSPTLRSVSTAALLGFQFSILATGTGWLSWSLWLRFAPASALASISSDTPAPGGNGWAAYLPGIVAVAIWEEVAFRGLLLPRAVARWGLLRGCLAISAFFAALHADAITAFIASMILSLIYLARMEIVSPIVFHAAVNLVIEAVGISLPFWTLGERSADENLRHVMSYFPFTVPCLLLGTVLMLTASRQMLARIRARGFPCG